MTASYDIVSWPADLLPKSYWNMILSRWKRSLRHGNDFFKLNDPEAFSAAYDRHIDQILHQGDAMVRLAVLTEDHDVALGFAVFRGAVLDYVHVHKDQRRLGIGSKLVPEAIHTITHLTKTGLIIWANKYPKWKFNAFA